MCNGWDSSVQPWTWAGPVANLWRTTTDIQPNFTSMLNNFHTNVGLASSAGPGAWNDPDMLEIGNGMSATEDQSEFSLWAEMAAPLIEGSNLASASSATLSILTNQAVIAVDQDSLGKQGTEVSASGGLDVLAKPLANGDVSVALFNETGSAATISTTAAAIGKTGSSSYTLTNLWTGATSTTTGTISASVPAHGTVILRVVSPALREPRGRGSHHAVAAPGPGRQASGCRHARGTPGAAAAHCTSTTKVPVAVWPWYRTVAVIVAGPAPTARSTEPPWLTLTTSGRSLEYWMVIPCGSGVLCPLVM